MIIIIQKAVKGIFAILMVLEQFASILIGIMPVVFQIAILLIYPSIPALFAVIVIAILSAIINACILTIIEINIRRAVIKDIFHRYKDSSFVKLDVSDYTSTDEMFNVKPDGVQGIALKPYLPHLEKTFHNIDITMIAVVPPANPTLILSGGQSYRSSFLTDSYVFVSSPQSLLSKFIIFHELGHQSFKSGSEAARSLAIRSIYVIMLLWIPWQMHWNILSVFVFTILLLQVFNHFGANAETENRLTRLQSEIYADKFAIERLTLVERKNFVKALVTIKRVFMDPKMPYLDNQIREKFMLEALNSEVVQPYSWLTNNVGNILQKFITIMVITVFFSNPPDYMISIVGSVITICFYFMLRAFIRLNLRLASAINGSITNPVATTTSVVDNIPLPQ